MKTWTLLLVVVLGLAGRAAGDDPVKEVFRDALFAEEGERDLAKAVAGYEKVVAAVDAQRGFGGSALFRLGECYRKLGKADEAAAAYGRVVREFPGEAGLVKEATERLEGMGRAVAPAVATAGGGGISEQELKELAEVRRIAQDSPDLLQGNWPGEPYTRLQHAAVQSYLKLAEFLLANGAEVNARNGATGQTALQVAVFRKHKTMAELLIANGADVNAVDDFGKSVLTTAVESGGDAVMKVLLDAGARTPKLGEAGREKLKTTPIGVASQAGDVEMVKRLAGLGVDEVKRALVEGHGVLLWAVAKGDVAMVKTLLALGADPNWSPVAQEEPPLFSAVDALSAEMVEVLLKAGADVDAEVDPSVARKHPTQRPQVGKQPTSKANRPEAAIRAALQAAQKRAAGSTSGRASSRRVVLPPPPRGGRGGAGQTGEAGEAGEKVGEKIMLRLMKRMSRLNGVAEVEAAEKIFRLLLDAGADVKAVDPDGNVSALHFAAMFNNGGEKIVAGVIGELLKRGADPWAKTEQGGIPIEMVKSEEALEALWAPTYYSDFEGRGDGVWLGRKTDGHFERYDVAKVDSMARLIAEFVNYLERSNNSFYMPDLKQVGILRAASGEWEEVDYAAFCEEGSVKDDVKLAAGDIVEFRGNDPIYGSRKVRTLGGFPGAIGEFVLLASRPEVVVKVGGEPERTFTVAQQSRSSQVFAPGAEVPGSQDSYRLLTWIGVMGRPDVSGNGIVIERSGGGEGDFREGVPEHGDRIYVPVLEAGSEEVMERRGRSLFVTREADGFIGRVASGRDGVLGLNEAGVSWGIYLTLAYGKDAKFFLPWPDLKRARIDLMSGTTVAAKEGEKWGFALDDIIPWGSYVEIPMLPEAQREERYGLDEALMLAVAARWARTVDVRVDGGELWPYETTEADFGGYWLSELGVGESYWRVGKWPSAEMKRYDSRSIELRRFLDDTGYADRKKFETSKVMISGLRLPDPAKGETLVVNDTRYVSGYSSDVLEGQTMITLRAVSGGGG